jgi:hypothetical protein
MADLPSNWGKMIEDVMKMDVWLVVISSSVGNNSCVDDVNLAHGPAIKPWFREQFFEKLPIPDLNVPTSHPKAFELGSSRNGTSVSMVEHPTNGRYFAVDAWDSHELDLCKPVENPLSYLKTVAMRSKNRFGDSIYREVEITQRNV